PGVEPSRRLAVDRQRLCRGALRRLLVGARSTAAPAATLAAPAPAGIFPALPLLAIVARRPATLLATAIAPGHLARGRLPLPLFAGGGLARGRRVAGHGAGPVVAGRSGRGRVGVGGDAPTGVAAGRIVRVTIWVRLVDRGFGSSSAGRTRA